MTSEEAAELVLQRPIYDPCIECAGTGRGEMGKAVIEGLDHDNNPVREEHQVQLQCFECDGTGLVLDGRYLRALKKTGAPTPLNTNVKYEPEVDARGLKRIFEVSKLVGPNNSRQDVLVFAPSRMIGPFPRNRQE